MEDMQTKYVEEQKAGSEEIARLNSKLVALSSQLDDKQSPSRRGDSPEAFALSPEAHSFDMGNVKKSHRRVTSRDDLERMYGS
eukprot:CAMPEP_0117887946 /NCGR_PEP_ID=MMETSP0950-20121206/21521_1 /TAXON_ID=44440 /ORGANISM="Chattonella subsalsa, Strain CCMP2191" /LENGTH=82 /DNA_ID=CAMNT_0005746087 /DNA_START=6 /DNA_END=251 /DNA_ORIENTATION=+